MTKIKMINCFSSEIGTCALKDKLFKSLAKNCLMNLGPLFGKRYFSTEGKGKDMLHINSLFEKNSLLLWLPSIFQNKVDETQRLMCNLKFIVTLVNVLNNLDKSFTYKLSFSLFLHTNDKDKELTFLLSSEGDIDLPASKDEILRVMEYTVLLREVFAYRGYFVFHSNELDLALVKDIEKYVYYVQDTLSIKVIYINDNISKEGFVEFKKPVLLKITRFDNIIDLGSSKKESVSNSCVDLSSNRRFNSIHNSNISINKFDITNRKKIFVEQRSFYSMKENFTESTGLNITPIEINITPVKNKSKTYRIWIDYITFQWDDLDTFIESLYYSNKLLPNIDYSIIVKGKWGPMIVTIDKKQHHFLFKSREDIYPFEKLYYRIVDRLVELSRKYKDKGVCEVILLEFRAVNVDVRLKISNLDIIKAEHPKVNISGVSKDLSVFGNVLNNVPGFPLNSKVVNGKLVINNTLDIKNLDKFLEEYNKNMTIKDKKVDYLVNDSTKFYIKYSKNRVFIISVNISKEGVYKRIFNIFGDLISKVKDIDNKDGTFNRESGNTTIVYKNDTILSISKTMDFSPIKFTGKNFSSNKKNWLPNSNIGTLDLETYECDGMSYCYAIGFYCNGSDMCNTYYIDKDLDSTKLILTCINEMLTPKYNKNTFYVHNLGKFDAPFIIKALIDYNKTEEGQDNPYILDLSTRNKDFLKLNIKRKINGRIHTINIKDSVAVLPRDLRSLCKDFEVEIEKSYFPYNFCTKNSLFYIGKTPNINYYENIPLDYYNSLVKEEWSLEEECIKYLEKDLMSLCQVLVKANRTFHKLFKIQMTDFLTISGISQQIFLEFHYNKDERPIPLVNNKIVWDDIYESYYGSRVEVFNPYFLSTENNKKLYYYDVNSLYPYASLNRMPGTHCTYIESFGESWDLDNLFGFFYCNVKSKDGYIGLLPRRGEKGNLTFPMGEWKGWYFSEELKFARDNGYQIDVIKGYSFNAISDVFTSFVSQVMGLKINAKNPTERTIAKLILNSLIGRFGMDFLKSTTKLLDAKTHDLVLSTRIVNSSIEISEDAFLDTFKLDIDKEICENFKLDYVKVLNTESIDEKSLKGKYLTVSLPIASATLAYARIHMSKLLLHVLNKEGKLSYTDTDSIMSDYKLEDEFVDKNELGKLKLEYEIQEGYFVADKTYAFMDTSGKIVKRAKGVSSEYLTLDDYKSMLKGETINAFKKTSERDYKKGSVVIRTKNNINLSTEYYDKRIKVFNENNQWIGTKPATIDSSLNLTFKNISLVLYNPYTTDIILYNPCTTDFIFYNTCSTDFVIWDFVMYNTTLPAVIPPFIFYEKYLIKWVYIAPLVGRKARYSLQTLPSMFLIIYWHTCNKFTKINLGIVIYLLPKSMYVMQPSSMMSDSLLNKWSSPKESETKVYKPDDSHIPTQVRSGEKVRFSYRIRAPNLCLCFPYPYTSLVIFFWYSILFFLTWTLEIIVIFVVVTLIMEPHQSPELITPPVIPVLVNNSLDPIVILSGMALLGLALLTGYLLVYPEFSNVLSGLDTNIPSLTITGPMSVQEIESIQRSLESRALLDNLSISPIGDLWISPWV